MSRGGLHESTHWLKCRHQICRNGFNYLMPCNILKNMPGGRLKVEVFGNRAWGGNNRKIRYVSKWKVAIRNENSNS